MSDKNNRIQGNRMTLVGRRIICTSDLAQAVSNRIALGLKNKEAALLSGIGQSTFYNWMKRGEAERARILAGDSHRRKVRVREAPFVEFLELVEAAIPRRKQVLLSQIQRAAAGGAQVTETRRVVKFDDNGDPLTVEERTTTRTLPADWKAAESLLERLHPDEFSRTARLELVDWRTRVITLLQTGVLTLDQIKQDLGVDLATELFNASGVAGDANGATGPAGPEERPQLPSGLPPTAAPEAAGFYFIVEEEENSEDRPARG